MSEQDNIVSVEEDTDQIQQALEKTVDEDTAALPLIPMNTTLVEATEIEEPEETEPFYELSDAHQGTEVADTTRIHRWFFTFMCMNIPIVGWIYLLNLAFSNKRVDRREFARAYLYYKLVFLLVSAVILGILIYIGMGMLDQLLAYMEML